jgi:antitoxin StbD
MRQILADIYEWLMDKLEDQALAQIVRQRMDQKSQAIEVSLDDL